MLWAVVASAWLQLWTSLLVRSWLTVGGSWLTLKIDLALLILIGATLRIVMAFC